MVGFVRLHRGLSPAVVRSAQSPSTNIDARAHDGPVTELGVPLGGGDASERGERIGETARRPAGPQTPAVHALLIHLERVGFRNAPRSLGLDDAGRHVLEYIPGRVAHLDDAESPPLDPVAVGRMVRELHDALEDWHPPDNAVWVCNVPTDGDDLVVHNDVAPWNIVVASDRLVIIDWDASSPGTRTWDLAYLAHGLVPLAPATPWPDVVTRLRGLAKGYGMDEDDRIRLAATLAPRAWSMYELLRTGKEAGEEPWARLWDEGHGAVWRRDAEWVEANAEPLREALLG